MAFAPYHDKVLAEWSSLSHGHRMVWLRATHSWPSNEAADELWRHASAFEREKWVNTTITSRAMHTLRATLAARGQQALAHHTRRHLSAQGIHDAEGAAAAHRRLHDSQGLTEEARRAMTEARQHVDPRLVRIMDEHHRSAGRGASNEQVLETVLGREQHGLAVAMQALANVRSHEVLDHIEQYTLVSIPPTQPPSCTMCNLHPCGFQPSTPEPVLRSLALHCVSAVPHRRARDTLLQVFRHPSTDVTLRQEAIQALGRQPRHLLREPEALGTLMHHLDSTADVDWDACYAEQVAKCIHTPAVMCAKLARERCRYRRNLDVAVAHLVTHAMDASELPEEGSPLFRGNLQPEEEHDSDQETAEATLGARGAASDASAYQAAMNAAAGTAWVPGEQELSLHSLLQDASKAGGLSPHGHTR